MVKKKIKKSHKVRNFRLNNEVMKWLKSIKKGTWNYTFINIKKVYNQNGNKKGTKR